MGAIRWSGRRGPRWTSVAALLVTSCLATHRASAQAGATTLQACTDAATRIVVARAVERIDDPGSGRTTARFSVQQVLKGSAGPATIRLEEASGAACGRALFGIVPGVRRILFVDSESEAPRLVRFGARALPVADSSLVRHVAELVRTSRNETARHRVLVGALDHDRARIRDDAARALAGSAGLDARGGYTSTRLLAALDASLDDPSVDPTPLWVAARRCDPPAALDRLCAGYLRTDREEILPLLQGVLLDTPADQLAGRLVSALSGTRTTPRSARRTAELVLRMPADSGRVRIAGALLPSRDRGVATVAASALLRGGTPATRLEGLVGPEVLEDAVRLSTTDDEGRAAVDAPNRWRSIDPERLR